MKDQNSTRPLTGSPSSLIPSDTVLHDRCGLPISGPGIGAMKFCSQCGKAKPLDEFHSSGIKSRPNAKRGRCKNCIKSNGYPSQKRYYLKNRASIIATMREYSLRTRDADTMYQRDMSSKIGCVSDGTVTTESLNVLMDEQQWKCAVSGKDLKTTLWSIDHIWPKSKGGANTITNIQIITESVNRHKSYVIPWEYCHALPPGWFTGDDND